MRTAQNQRAEVLPNRECAPNSPRHIRPSRLRSTSAADPRVDPGASNDWIEVSTRPLPIRTEKASGGLGNVIDRLARSGFVTDFLNVGIGPLRTGIFNFADFALFVGVGIIVLFGTSSTHTAAPE
jgi:hypothetical protein